MNWYIAEDADAAGATRKSSRKWFCAGWNARDRRAAAQIRSLVESYSEDLQIRQERIDLARAERDNLRRRAVPEGYVVLAQTDKGGEVEYVVVKEDQWLEAIGEVLE